MLHFLVLQEICFLIIIQTSIKASDLYAYSLTHFKENLDYEEMFVFVLLLLLLLMLLLFFVVVVFGRGAHFCNGKYYTHMYGLFTVMG